MPESKLPHALASFVLSISSAGYAWFEHYGSGVATAIAIMAGLYSLWASHQTIRVCKRQNDKMDKEKSVVDE